MVETEYSDADVHWFWHIIEQAEMDRERLRAILANLSRAETFRFQDLFVEFATELQDEPYTLHVAPDESEDGVADISHLVVSQGEDVYNSTISQPEQMPSHVDVGDPRILFPVAYDVYYERFGEPLDVI